MARPWVSFALNLQYSYLFRLYTDALDQKSIGDFGAAKSVTLVKFLLDTLRKVPSLRSWSMARPWVSFAVKLQ